MSFFNRAALALAGALLSAAGAQAEDLKFANFMPATHPYVAGAFDPFAAKVAGLTGGKLTVAVYNGGELGAGPVEQYARVTDGVAELAFGLPGYTATNFPLTLLAELPGVLPAGTAGAEDLADHLDAFTTEYRRVQLVSLWPNTPNLLLTRDKAVHGLDDIRGLKIRVPSRNSGLLVQAWGAAPVSMPVTDLYNALQTGVIDGALIDASALTSFKLAEVINHVTMGMQTTTSPFFVIMDRKVFAKLPPAEQGAVLEAGREMGLQANKVSQEIETAGLAAFAAMPGRDVIRLTPGEAAPFDAVAGTARAGAAEKARGKGLPADEVIAALTPKGTN